MGTRADFYVGRGPQAEWVGSIAFDGYPNGIDKQLLECTGEAAYRHAVTAFLESRFDSILPEAGWPWPWEDSFTTDYAYAFDGEKVHITDSHQWSDGHDVAFPNMKDRKQHSNKLGVSGLIVLGVPE